jgi:hypothetical protein
MLEKDALAQAKLNVLRKIAESKVGRVGHVVSSRWS